MMTDLLERFWEKVAPPNEYGCLLWTGCTNGRGYGLFGRGKKVYAHRLAKEQATGKSIPDGMEVCHNCEEYYLPGDITFRRCVNDAHMYIGTHRDNMRDMVHNGRSNGARGEQNGHAKLIERQVRAIRLLFATGKYSKRELARRYKVNHVLIGEIVRRERWRQV